MRALAYYWACVRRAWSGSISLANSWGPIIGAIPLALIYRAIGKQVTFAEGWIGVAEVALGCLGAAWVLIFVARLIIAPYQLHRELEEVLHSKQNTGQISSLRRVAILSGYNSPFVKDENIPGGIKTTVFVAVQNIGEGSISKCRLYIEDVDPHVLGFGSILLTPDSFSLFEGESKILPIAYFEKTASSAAMGIYSSSHPAANDGAINLPYNKTFNAYSLNLRASALDMSPCETTIDLFVDPTGRFWLQQMPT